MHSSFYVIMLNIIKILKHIYLERFALSLSLVDLRIESSCKLQLTQIIFHYIRNVRIVVITIRMKTTLWFNFSVLNIKQL